MLKTSILIFLSYLVIASATNPTLTKTAFFPTGGAQKFSANLFNTQNGIIGRSFYSEVFFPMPQYVSMNIKTGTVKQIQLDFLFYCDYGGTLNSNERLHYHAKTSTLVYYCGRNNSLLILNEKDYTIQSSIPIQTNTTFVEVKLTSLGDSVLIFGMGYPYSDDKVAPSQFITVNMLQRNVFVIFTFDKELSVNETVAAFTTGDTGSFIMTTIKQGIQITNNIYSVIFIAGTYELALLKTFTYNTTTRYPVDSYPIIQLYSLGNYIVTNFERDLVFLNLKGEIVQQISSVAPNLSYGTLYNLLITVEDESSDLYALFANNSLIKFTVSGTIITSVNLGSATSFSLVTGNAQVSSLLFTGNNLFNITDLHTSKLVYSSILTYNDILTTDSTYSAIYQSTIFIFDFQTNLLISQVAYSGSYYYDQGNYTLYFLNANSALNQCNLFYVDLRTGNTGQSYTLGNTSFCSYTIDQLKVTQNGSFVLALRSGLNLFYVISPYYSPIKFQSSPYQPLQVNIADDKGMSLYVLTSMQKVNVTNVTYCEYNAITGNFRAKETNILVFTLTEYKPIYGGKGLLNRFSRYAQIIDLQQNAISCATLESAYIHPSVFQDKQGSPYYLFSGAQTWDKILWLPNIIPDSTKVASELVGCDSHTVQAGAGGICMYWLVDGSVKGFGNIKFYNVCSQKTTEAIQI